jgi:hypothetical protein
MAQLEIVQCGLSFSALTGMSLLFGALNRPCYPWSLPLRDLTGMLLLSGALNRSSHE